MTQEQKMSPNEAKRALMIDKIVGKAIHETRIKIDMSQSRLAELCGDITFQQIQKYERGTNRVSISRLYQIADALGVPVTYLLPTDRDTGAEKMVKRIAELQGAMKAMKNLITAVKA